MSGKPRRAFTRMLREAAVGMMELADAVETSDESLRRDAMNQFGALGFKFAFRVNRPEHTVEVATLLRRLADCYCELNLMDVLTLKQRLYQCGYGHACSFSEF